MLIKFYFGRRTEHEATILWSFKIFLIFRNYIRFQAFFFLLVWALSPPHRRKCRGIIRFQAIFFFSCVGTKAPPAAKTPWGYKIPSFTSVCNSCGIWYIPCLVLIMTLRFTCGAKKLVKTSTGSLKILQT